MKTKYFNLDVYISIFLIIVSIYAFIDASKFPEGSNIAPMICSVLLIISCSFVLWKGLKSSAQVRANMDEKTVAKIEKDTKEMKISLISYGLCVGYVLAIPNLGFFTSTTLFLLSFMYYLKIRRYLLAIIVTLGFNLAIYILFVYEMGVNLPKGLLF